MCGIRLKMCGRQERTGACPRPAPRLALHNVFVEDRLPHILIVAFESDNKQVCERYKLISRLILGFCSPFYPLLFNRLVILLRLCSIP